MKVSGYEIKPEVNLTGADLRGADLRWADLAEANLYGAKLTEANLTGADLTEADLTGASLHGADLHGASLYGVNLTGANLRWASLYGADLSGTCLDPANKANADVADFVETLPGGRIVGYRSRACPHIGGYRVGRIYGADFFSTSDTECHPGLYLWPTLEMARNWSGAGAELVKVVANPEHTHKTGSKWRTRWFEVIEEIL